MGSTGQAVLVNVQQQGWELLTLGSVAVASGNWTAE
jgi:hypothetical protein